MASLIIALVILGPPFLAFLWRFKLWRKRRARVRGRQCLQCQGTGSVVQWGGGIHGHGGPAGVRCPRCFGSGIDPTKVNA